MIDTLKNEPKKIVMIGVAISIYGIYLMMLGSKIQKDIGNKRPAVAYDMSAPAGFIVYMS